MIRVKTNNKNQQMLKLMIWVLLCLFINSESCAEVPGDPFPAFSSLKKPIKISRNATLSIDKDGTFLINGKPRYLISTLYYEEVPATLSKHTTGYPAELNWLYEDVLDYEGHQRLGFDATGIFSTSSWIRKYRNRGDDALHDPQVRKIVSSGLPLYLDFTCAPWHHGAIKYEKGKLPSKSAFNVSGEGNNHWMPYSATTPEGRQLYLEMWRTGAETMKKIGGKPFVYELFNEPDYNDWSSFNRKLFSERMVKKYKTIDKLNNAWHTSYKNFQEMSNFKHTKDNTALFIEWAKFMEACFIDICRAGIEEIKKIDKRPEVLFCYQPMCNLTSNANLYQTNRYMNAICAPTTGGNALYARLLHAIAKGKPIFDGETYVDNTRTAIRNKFWLQYARGFNASFVFKWDRRPYDRYWKNADETGGKIVAERFPYLMLNPYALPPRELLGIMDAKREILKVNELFTPRNRGIKSEIALLFSLTSKRLARATGSVLHTQNEDYALALGYAPFNYDAVFEEQLKHDSLQKYQVMVVAGIEAASPCTPAALRKFVRKGGLLIFGQEALQKNEYGFPRKLSDFPGVTLGKEINLEPAELIIDKSRIMATPYREIKFDPAWKVVQKLHGHPVILSRKMGKGKMIYLNARMPLESRCALLRKYASEKNINTNCTLTNYQTSKTAVRIEVNKAKRNDMVGYILINKSLGTQLIRFRPKETCETFVNPLDGKEISAKNGEYFLTLSKDERCVIVGGNRAILQRRFGVFPKESFTQAQKNGLLQIEENAKKTGEDFNAFNVDQNQIRTIDLRFKANNGFHDSATWKKAGEKGIQNVPPWGVVNCNGIPCRFIRGDHNGERTCIVVGTGGVSSVHGVAVDKCASNIYFLHAALQSKKGTVLHYTVNYRDGSKMEVPIQNGIEIDCWKNIKKKVSGRKAVPGWKNLEGEGLWLYRWNNPTPEKVVASIDITAAPNETGGLLGAISIEEPLPKDKKFYPLRFYPKNFRPHVWGGLKTSFDNDEITFHLDEKSINWCSCNFIFHRPIDIPEGFEGGSLVFEANGGNDTWGNHRGGQILQVHLYCQNATGKEIKSGSAQMSPQNSIDSNPESWQIVKIPLKLILPANAEKLNSLFLQFTYIPRERSGIQLRNIRFEK